MSSLREAKQIKAVDLDFENEAHFEAFAQQFKDEFTTLISKQHKVSDESAIEDIGIDIEALLQQMDDDKEDDDVFDEVEETREEKQKAQIDSLSAEIGNLQNRLKKKFSADTWKQLSKTTTQLTDLKNRYRREQFVKSQQREAFLKNSFGTQDDFERLWNSTLRDETLRRESENLDSLRRTANHPLYRSAFSQS